MSELNTKSVRENKMGTMPVGKLLISMSVPMMISMMVQAFYNVVDSYFVAKISENALTAVSHAFPLQSLMIAFATGTGVGINALLSMRLGQKNFEEVNKSALNGIFLSVLTTIAFMIIGFTVPGPYFRSQSETAEIIDYGIKYTRIVLIFSFGLFGGLTFERLLQGTGKTVLSMVAQLAGAITNIILDPILIFGLIGLPKMEIEGAAIATVIGQFVTLILAFFFNIFKNKEINFSLKKFWPSIRIIGQIYRVGVPSILLASVGSVMTYLMNKILGSFTETAVAVFGVYFKLQSIIFMPVFGMNNALVPIVAYNYGARSKKRITGTIKLGLLIALLFLAIGMALFEFIPGPLLSIFEASETMLAIGTKALRIIGFHFVPAAFSIIFLSVFQALGKGIYSMITSFVRQIIVLVPAAYLLSLTGSVDNVWWSFPIAEVVAVSIASTFMLISYKKEIAPLEKKFD